MAPVYSSAFAPPTTNKIGAMVPVYFSMTPSHFADAGSGLGGFPRFWWISVSLAVNKSH